MKESILEGKKILVVDDEPDILTVIEEEIKGACKTCDFDKASTYDEAVRKIEAKDYDIVILDIMGVNGFDLLDLAVKKNLRVAMLTAHALSPEALKRSHDMGARAYIPKEKIGELVPLLEEVFKHDFEHGWRHLLESLSDYFNKTFEADWKKRSGLPSLLLKRGSKECPVSGLEAK